MSAQKYTAVFYSAGHYGPYASKHLTEAAQTLIESIASFSPLKGVCQSFISPFCVKNISTLDFLLDYED
jgi:hypothetical protein